MVMNNDIENFLAQELEGGLYACITVNNVFGNSFIAVRDLYTVLDGVCYQICGNDLVKSEDNLIHIKASCKRIGKYDRNKSYYRKVSKEYTYAEMKKLFKL